MAWRSKGGDILNADLVRLEREQLEQLADLVAERLAGAGRVLASRLVDAKEVARWLNVEPDFVYANAVALGARRLGDGPKARLRSGRAVSPPPALLAGSQPNVFPLLRHRFDDAARGAHWAQASTCCPFGTQSTLETSLRSPQERPHEQLSAGRGAVATAPPVA